MVVGALREATDGALFGSTDGALFGSTDGALFGVTGGAHFSALEDKLFECAYCSVVVSLIGAENIFGVFNVSLSALFCSGCWFCCIGLARSFFRCFARLF